MRRLLGKLKAWMAKGSEKPLYPESLWTVSLATASIQAIDQTGTTAIVAFDDLNSIAIATNDTGPWGADVWWLMYGPDGQLACAFPQGATGEAEVIEYLMALQGFDNEQMIQAMGSTANAVFPVWKKSN